MIEQKIRIVTAAALFDGHDAAINVMRRVMQAKGAEIIHLGHNRSVAEIVECAIEEDVHGIAITSYQGGHLEFFKYMKDLLTDNGAGHIKIFGGGGGTILPAEIEELHQYGISRIYSPDDGRHMGLEGMIEDVIRQCEAPSQFSMAKESHLYSTNGKDHYALGEWKDITSIAKAITLAEAGEPFEEFLIKKYNRPFYATADPSSYKLLKEFSLEHRKNGTDAETLLWNHLRDKQFDGIKFRRQHVIDTFIADFISLDRHLIIEVDGLVHQMPDVKLNDEQRTERLNELGYKVLRLSNDAILNNINSALDIIKEATKVSPTGGDLEGAGAVVIGITGTGGSGKSSVTDELVRRYLHAFADKTIAVISVDPSRKKTGGALLGDRIRMNAIHHPRAYMRSLATRESDKALSKYVQEAIDICKDAGYDMIILESAGVGQSDASILDFCEISIYVMTPEYGAASQLEKINMLDYADIICINKFDKAGGKDALQDVQKQYRRNHNLFSTPLTELPVIGTIASKFNDDGVNNLFRQLLEKIKEKTAVDFGVFNISATAMEADLIIPARRSRYLAEIADDNKRYQEVANEQAAVASNLFKLFGTINLLSKEEDKSGIESIQKLYTGVEAKLTPENKRSIQEWEAVKQRYQSEYFEYDVRGKKIKQPLFFKSLSNTNVPKIAVPKYSDWGDILQWKAQENFPGQFPYTAGVFPLKRQEEDPTRMFAGEGGPERTNRRFHYVSVGQPAKRLSTAFDSVTLYGENPAIRPDIFGKVGNSGVSIATVDDAKKLYSGFDLCDPKTSVSMTINGPAPMILAFFLNAAIDQQCEKYIITNNLNQEVNNVIETRYNTDLLPKYIGVDDKPVTPKGEHIQGILPAGNAGLGLRLLGLSGSQVLPPEVYEQIKQQALNSVRGTVQADILKEDQAQNTCIFSTEFALKLMGDVQQYFIENKVRNFYSVSISGYHIAEAGANPITQLAFTLSNGFTYVEYYLSRGMHIDDFAPNLSFFFSNGMDPEYSVIGRVARRIWAKAIRNIYKGNERSQMLKYHIQTSGRSLHAQEIDFNDIRTTLQALYAIYDNCNSLHTNAYDEAITTPTEESVRRAMAIQLIINRELGTAKNENPNQGSFLIEELTDLVEEAVMKEFYSLSERGGVLGAMERMYQRNKIQEESLYYETLKHTGEYPVVGVNTFLNKNGSPTILPAEVIRSSNDEKNRQIENLKAFHERNAEKSGQMLKRLQQTAVENGNIFAELMETVKFCSLGQITHALYEVGGQYRRNM